MSDERKSPPDQSESVRADRDELAVRIAEALWPGRYVGDLSRSEWDRAYAMVDAGLTSDEGER